MSQANSAPVPVGKTIVQLWMDEVRARHKESGASRFTGKDGDDYDGFISICRDAALVTDYTMMSHFLEPNCDWGKVHIHSTDLRKALIAMRSVITPDTSPGAVLVKKYEDHYLLAERQKGVTPLADARAHKLFKGVLQMLQKLSRQDDSAKYWVDLLASVTISSTSIQTSSEHHTKKTGDAWMAVFMLEEIYDRLVEIQRQVGQQKGTLKPSTLKGVPLRTDWTAEFEKRGLTDEEVAHLVCAPDDNPVLIIEAAHAAYSKRIAETEPRLVEVEKERDRVDKGSDEAKELTSLAGRLQADLTEWQTERNALEKYLPECREAYSREEERRTRLLHDDSEDWSQVRVCTTYDGRTIEEGDVRLIPSDDASRVRLFFTKCPRVWKSKLSALGFPMRNLPEVAKAIALYDSLTLDGQAPQDRLGASKDAAKAPASAKKGVKTPGPSGGPSPRVPEGGPPPGKHHSYSPAPYFQRQGGPGGSGGRGGGQSGFRGGGLGRHEYGGGGPRYEQRGGGKGGKGGGRDGRDPYRTPKPQFQTGLNAVEVLDAAPTAGTAPPPTNPSSTPPADEAVPISEVRVVTPEEGTSPPEMDDREEQPSGRKKKKKKKKVTVGGPPEEELGGGVPSGAAPLDPSSGDPGPGRGTVPPVAAERASFLKSRAEASQASRVVSSRSQTEVSDTERKEALASLEFLLRQGGASMLSGTNTLGSVSINTITALVFPGVEVTDDVLAAEGLFPSCPPSYTEYMDQEGNPLVINSLGDTVYRVKLRLGSGDQAVVVNALLDGGAGANLIRKDAWEKLPEQVRALLVRSRQTLLSACTTTMASMGTVELLAAVPCEGQHIWSPPSALSRVEVMHRLHDEMIVGVPGLKSLRILQDFDLGTVLRRTDHGEMVSVPTLSRSRDRDQRLPVTTIGVSSFRSRATLSAPRTGNENACFFREDNPRPGCPSTPKASGLGVLKMLPSAWTSSTGVGVSTLSPSFINTPRVSEEVETLCPLRPACTPLWELARVQDSVSPCLAGDSSPPPWSELPDLMEESEDEIVPEEECECPGCTSPRIADSDNCAVCSDALCTFCGECAWHVPRSNCPEHGEFESSSEEDEGDEEDGAGEVANSLDSEVAGLGVCGARGATNTVPGGPRSYTRE